MSCYNWCNTRNTKEKCYDKLGLYSLSKRRWRSKLIFLYAILNGFWPKYLHSYLTSPSQENYLLRSALTAKVDSIPSRTNFFIITFFPYCINEWNNLNTEVRNAKSIRIFKKMILTEEKGKFPFSAYDPLDVKLLTHLRLQFSHLNEHKFRHGFGDTVSPTCGCNAKIDKNSVSRCHFYSTERFELFNNITKVDLVLHN